MAKENVRTLPASRGDPLVDDIIADSDQTAVTDMNQTSGSEQGQWAASISAGNSQHDTAYDNVLHMDQHLADPDAARQAKFDQLDRGLAEAVRRHDDRFL